MEKTHIGLILVVIGILIIIVPFSVFSGLNAFDIGNWNVCMPILAVGGIFFILGITILLRRFDMWIGR